MNTNILRRDMNITGNIILIKRNIGRLLKWNSKLMPLLSIVVFLTIAQELLPATALPRLSAICVTLTIDMFMSGCIIISVIISSWLYHRSTDKTIPLWIQKMVRCQKYDN
jgi:hypothetical protein